MKKLKFSKKVVPKLKSIKNKDNKINDGILTEDYTSNDNFPISKIEYNSKNSLNYKNIIESTNSNEPKFGRISIKLDLSYSKSFGNRTTNSTSLSNFTEDTYSHDLSELNVIHIFEHKWKNLPRILQLEILQYVSINNIISREPILTQQIFMDGHWKEDRSFWIDLFRYRFDMEREVHIDDTTIPPFSPRWEHQRPIKPFPKILRLNHRGLNLTDEDYQLINQFNLIMENKYDNYVSSKFDVTIKDLYTTPITIKYNHTLHFNGERSNSTILCSNPSVSKTRACLYIKTLSSPNLSESKNDTILDDSLFYNITTRPSTDRDELHYSKLISTPRSLVRYIDNIWNDPEELFLVGIILDSLNFVHRSTLFSIKNHLVLPLFSGLSSARSRYRHRIVRYIQAYLLESIKYSS